MKKSGRVSSARIAVAAALLVLLVAALVAAGCGSSNSTSSSNSSANTGGGSSDTILGAGATFPFPIYSKWAVDYQAVAGTKLNYQSIGSGGGISAIEAKTVFFGASDAPLKQADLAANGLVQFPAIVGGDVAVINVKGIAQGALKLDAPTLAGIFMGKIKTWNDPAIKALNAGVTLPSTAITVVHRSDGSGTTWIFTHYLTAAAGNVWTAGADKTINWPVGVGGKGNDGVASLVQKVNGTIGYVEYAYAKKNNLNWTQLKNADGAFVSPSLDAFAAAADKADWKNAPGFYLALVNQPGATTWPIVGASFILMQKDQTDANQAQSVLKFFDWAYKNGGAAATSLDYVPIPASAYDLVEQMWSTITVSGTPVWPA